MFDLRHSGFLEACTIGMQYGTIYVWALQRDELLEFISRAQHGDARAWLHEAIAVLQHDDLIRLVVTMWSIWYTRRKAVLENIFQRPLLTHSFIEKLHSRLGTCRATGERESGRAGPGRRVSSCLSLDTTTSWRAEDKCGCSII
jgi:hypothetical protein